MVFRKVRKWVSAFDWSQVFTTTAGYLGWAIKDTSAAGTPTYTTVSGGGAALTLVATSEEEIVTLYQKDILPFNILKVQRMSWLAKVAGVDAVTTLVMGLASAQNDTEDSVVTNAWFRIEGSASTTAVVVETDDGTNDLDDKATGATLASTYKEFVIDFTNGLSDVRFYIDGERVGAATTMTMAALTSATNVQPFFQIHKASGTGTPAVTIKELEVVYDVVEGS